VKQSQTSPVPALSYDPPLPDSATETPRPNSLGFTQTICLSTGPDPIGQLTWTTNDPGDGVAQITMLDISPPHRRRGHGRRLLDAALDQIRRFHQSRGHKLRRVWAIVRQKDHVIGRAFLTGRGFHHVSGIPNLFSGQDTLVYVKGMD
jgi:ribosomal protein S18 acetylase RimI-like enzyme